MSERPMSAMRAMVLDRPNTPLVMRERPIPQPAYGEILIEVAACGVCRTDLHVVDGELPHPKLPIVPGHEIVGRVAALGPGVTGFARGERCLSVLPVGAGEFVRCPAIHRLYP
jgi:propanol-preferring alcohol dehydrogenase